ncbi:MAG: hypothetical protein IPP04_01105 [Saprospiraceae bacterium]|nr:hypothetical protein [Saprospiraceae bacterium]MBL0110664.1 hypothetical protein [Saprospiraceae bacterium]
MTRSNCPCEAESGAVPGNELPVFTTDFGTIGILICWDYAFPEVARIINVNVNFPLLIYRCLED